MMVLDSVPSPRRRSQNSTILASSSKKQTLSPNEFDSCSILFERHRFLLTMLALLAALCTFYLYFAVTLGEANTCSGMTVAERAICLAKASASLGKGKLKFH